MEVASQVFLALDEGYLKANDADELLTSLSALVGQIGALNRALKVAPSKVKLPGVETDATHLLRQRAE